MGQPPSLEKKNEKNGGLCARTWVLEKMLKKICRCVCGECSVRVSESEKRRRRRVSAEPRELENSETKTLRDLHDT